MNSILPFFEYINHTRAIIEKRRTDNHLPHIKKIVDANSPFELCPNYSIGKRPKFKYGALLIHGLLDSPFSLRDIGERLQANNILSRAILLPGHGTRPSDLISISYRDWIEAVQYGVESLRQDVEQIFLIGYSTGAALSIYHALQDSTISGILLLSPAIKIKAPVNVVVSWHYLIKNLSQHHKQWLFNMDENDYTKYRSIPFNAVTQVSKLTSVIRKLCKQHHLSCPIYMVISREDETISSLRAIHFFSSLSNKDSKLLLYHSRPKIYRDPRILTRLTDYSHANIKHFSHTSIPISPYNFHYGEQGDYLYASCPSNNKIIFGAYNQIETRVFKYLHDLGLIQHARQELTYNPDFSFMSEQMVKFILSKN